MKPAVWCVTYDGEMTNNLFLGEGAAKDCLDRLNREYPADEARRAVVALAPVAAAVQGDAHPLKCGTTRAERDAMRDVQGNALSAAEEARRDAELYGVGFVVNGSRVEPAKVVMFRNAAQRAASQTTPVRTYDWSREGMELADGQSGAYVRHFDFVMKNASQDTVPTTVANQAINDALRLVSKDSERDVALMEAAAIAEKIPFAMPASPTERAFNTGIESAAKCIRQAIGAVRQEPKS